MNVEKGIQVKRQHIGLGPMGTAVFYSASNIDGQTFADLFRGGVALVNRTRESVGSGQFHGLAIDTNSDPIDSIRYIPVTKPFGVTPEARKARREIERLAGQEFCGFPVLSAYYHAIGLELGMYAEGRNDGSSVVEAVIDHVVYDQRAQTFTSVDTRGIQRIQSSEIVLATGGIERTHPDLVKFGEKVMLSRDVLLQDKETVREKLAEARAKGQHSIVILGNGNSGLGALGEITKLDESKGFEIILAYKSKFYRNYESLEQAKSRGYTPDPDELSSAPPYQVNRVRGLRYGAQETLDRAQAGELGSISFIQFDGDVAGLEFLEQAGLIIQAFGFEGNTPCLVDVHGREIPLQRQNGREVVDRHDQLVTADGTPISGAYRVGMGTFKPEGWELPGYKAEAALTAGPIDGVKAYQGPGGSGEKLALHLVK